ncbi:MAG: hypothetical protein M9965_15535 [Anaerolineae bacterium]|nr:hypothetical protein [Anaerolineae bacterium]
MSTISRNSFSLAHMRARGVRQIALLLIMASALLVALYFAATLPVAGAGVLTITSNTGPFAVFDSNKPADQSPGVFTAEAQVCNTGDAPLTDVLLYIGDGTTVGEFPDTTVGGTVYELMLLDEVVNGDVSDGTRYFSNSLAPGDCVGVFWQVDYPNVAAVNGQSFGFTIWGEADADGTTVTDSETDSIITRSTISASANKINPLNRTVTPAGPYDIGEQLEICYTNVNFGVIGAGESGANDFWFQPVGDTAFNPDSLTLVSTEVTLYTDKCTNDPYVFTDITYFRADRRRNAARRLGQRRCGGMFAKLADCFGTVLLHVCCHWQRRQRSQSLSASVQR